MKRLVGLALAVTLLMLMCGCGTGDSTGRAITDMAGDEVILPAKIERVASTSDPCTDMLIAFGAGDKLAAVYKTALENPWFETFYPGAAQLKSLDSYEPEVESLIADDINVIFVPTAERAEALREKGICAVCIRYYTPEEVAAAAKLLGEIFGGKVSEASTRWVADFDKAIEEVGKRVSGIPEEKRPVTYEIMGDKYRGLFRTNYGMGQAWLEYGGGVIATKEFTGATSDATPTEEAILAKNPDVIFIGGTYSTQLEADLFADAKWADIAAVKNKRVYLVPVGCSFWNGGTVEYPLMVYYVYSCLYPDQTDFDIYELARNFYSEYYGIDFDAEAMNNMLNALSPAGNRMGDVDG